MTSVANPLEVLLRDLGETQYRIRANGTLTCGHSWKHESKSNTCLVIWPDAARWWCSSCKAKGTLADLLVDAGKVGNWKEGWERLESYGVHRPGNGPPNGNGNGNGHTNGKNGHHKGNLADFPLTDVGNAERLVLRHGHDLHYCHGSSSWYIWDGKRWRRDDSGEIERRAKETIRAMAAEARDLFDVAANLTQAAGEDQEKQKQAAAVQKKADALLTWARKSEAAPRIAAMIALARSEPGIPVASTELDANPWLLNAQNGTIDLRTKALFPHRREDLITKILPVPYSPDAKHPLWDRFLLEAIPDEEVRQYIQRVAGYTVSGQKTEDLVLLVRGPGGSGKSTFKEAMMATLGEYAASTVLEIFTSKHNAHAAQPGLVRLAGRRLVTISEIDSGGLVSLLKRVSGGDTIQARDLYKGEFEFQPTFTIWIMANQRPRIPDDDTGIWRRLREIPFDTKFEHPDPSIREKLKDPSVAGQAILAWLVDGCFQWQTYGIGETPQRVLEATEEYRQEMNPLAEWLAECTIAQPNAWTSVADLRHSYEEWGKANGDTKYLLGTKKFSQRLKDLFIPKAEGRNKTRGFLGIALRAADTSEPDEVSARTLQKQEVPANPADNEAAPENADTCGHLLSINPSRARALSPLIETKCPQVSEVSAFITDAEEARRLAWALKDVEFVALDLETTGLDPHTDRARLLALATVRQSWVVDLEKVPVHVLNPILLGGPRKIAHNAKFDCRFLMGAGVARPYPWWDTLLADQLLHNRSFGNSLAEVAKRYLDVDLDKTLQDSDFGGEISPEQVAYARKDAEVLIPLHQALTSALEEAGMSAVASLEMDALPAIAWMEHQGASFNLDAWTALADEAEQKKAVHLKQLMEIVTEDLGANDLFGQRQIDWDSVQQVTEVLRLLGIEVSDTRQETLDGLRDQHRIIPVLLEYREAAKRSGTYGMDWLKHVSPATGRLHADWRQIGAESGRMACRKPNLQNLPRDPRYRACFEPGPGRVLVKADYSQIELRIIAQMSGDAQMRKAFEQGNDLHTLTAAVVMGKEASEVTPEERQMAKAVNFGLVYGMGARGLKAYAKNSYGVTLTDEQAEQFRARYFQAFAGVRKWHQTHVRDAESRTLIGRRRILRPNGPPTEKYNSPVQGTGADLLKLALVNLWDSMPPRDTWPVAVVHDEIQVECPTELADEASEWVKTAMEKAGAQMLNIPVVVEVKHS